MLAYLHAQEVVEKKLGRAGAFPTLNGGQNGRNNAGEEEGEEEEKKPEAGTCVLVFFAGLGDIEDAYERLSAQTDHGGGPKLEVHFFFNYYSLIFFLSSLLLLFLKINFLLFKKVFALHSLLDREQQMAVFAPVPKGVTRIILATNIAESSITLPSARFFPSIFFHFLFFFPLIFLSLS